MKPSRFFAASQSRSCATRSRAKRRVAFTSSKVWNICAPAFRIGTEAGTYPAGHAVGNAIGLGQASAPCSEDGWLACIVGAVRRVGKHLHFGVEEIDFVPKGERSMTASKTGFFRSAFDAFIARAPAPGRPLRQQCAAVAGRRDAEEPRLQPRRACASAPSLAPYSALSELPQRFRCSVTQPSRRSVRTCRKLLADIGGDDRVALALQNAGQDDRAAGRDVPRHFRRELHQRPRQDVGDDQVERRAGSQRPDRGSRARCACRHRPRPR